MEESKAERRIVVAVDAGEESAYALLWCVKNMVDEGDVLFLLHVAPVGAVYTSMDTTGYLFSDDVVDSMEKYGNEMADSVMQKAMKICSNLQNVKVEKIVEKGDARDVICNKVEKLGSHLLVMGTHGYGPIKRAFLGSVSNHCAQNVKCPVLIVKTPKH